MESIALLDRAWAAPVTDDEVDHYRGVSQGTRGCGIAVAAPGRAVGELGASVRAIP